MCGIAGYAGEVHPDPRTLSRMCDALRHRGPDDVGEFAVPGQVGLGFRRLSIIDLEGGHQPLANEDDSVQVTCNGEIYNFRSLQTQLTRSGHTLRTGSDTEVIAHLWEERGLAALEALEGMFAVALWDASTRTLLLARDRMGVKPLYWAPVPGGLVYASEPAAILASGLVRAQPDPEAIVDCLVLQYVHAPRTGFKGIYKLAPGERLLFRDGDIEVKRWWQLNHPTRPLVTDPARALDELDELMGRATSDRLIADVPLGAFLSGGVDSSVVVSYMAEQLGTVKTFSIDFPVGGFSEAAHARRVSSIYGTTHEEFLVEPDMVPVVAEAVRHLGEPFADSSAIPTYLLSELTRRDVTVALSGDGGDEALGGYVRYLLASQADRFGPVATPVGRVAQAGLPGLITSRWPKAGRAAAALALSPAQRYASLMSHFTPGALEELLTPQMRSQAGSLTRPWEILKPPSLLGPNRYCALDVETYLPGDLLTKVDRMSMTHALEVRSPMLDHRLHEWCATLAGNLKIRRRTTKWLLKELAVRRGVPHEVVHRPKQGFAIPIGTWFRSELRPWVEDVLFDPRSTARDITRTEAVRALVDDHVTGQTDHTARIWNLMMLELWHREHIDA